MSFWDHLDELRRRLVRTFAAIVVCTVAGFWIAPKFQEFLVQPFVEKVPGNLALLAPSDGFVIQLKIALLIGIVAASPFGMYQLYGFIGPALKTREKMWLWPVVILATLLFWSGVVFAWLILPAALEFLGSFAQTGIQNFWSLNSYIGLVLFLLVAFGSIFQLPLVIGVLIATGLVPSAFFRRNRRYAIVLMVVLSAFATPTTDWLTMSLMAAPLIVLYELSIWVGVLIDQRRSKSAALAKVP